MDTILVVNSGSSSLKFQVFGIAKPTTLKRLVKGQLDGIGTQPRLRVKGSDDAVLIDQTHAPEAVGDVSAAIGVAAAWLKETQNLAPIAVGHRVVHGGPDYGRPVLVDDQVLANLARLTSLAPLHQPHNLAPIGLCWRAFRRFPKSPASIRRFTGDMIRSSITMPYPSGSMLKVSAAMAFTAFPMNMSQSVFGRWRQALRKVASS